MLTFTGKPKFYNGLYVGPLFPKLITKGETVQVILGFNTKIQNPGYCSFSMNSQKLPMVCLRSNFPKPQIVPFLDIHPTRHKPPFWRCDPGEKFYGLPCV